MDDAALEIRSIDCPDFDQWLAGENGGRLTLHIQAGPQRRFAPGAMDSQVGHVIDARLPGRAEAVSVRLVAAQVIDDGTAVRLTVVREPQTH